ncbi:class I SAM-dependent methyltransferase [Bradyrhizobium sp. LHD-71]|uniref:class I SAM-dependent methyltransferase n=1 Tax=Bradyrhizobium sp. LHD-71 TaxID=3072141 RepID=UPI00280D7D4A|nr:class I SAM-dependent methyltransferase [Bradyrhizobium sp. LHD-71]MDQ8727653.1 class I SAM-dependent methyltransferase [Bradyrhizobium sp. LHD-71]
MLRRLVQMEKNRRGYQTLSFTLPPKGIRFCTEEWQDDGFYFASAVQEVFRLRELCGLSENTRFLDIGSGQGRLAIGLQAAYPKLKSYDGIDVHQPSVNWCKRHLERQNFRFMHVDTANERYNPSGKHRSAIPLDDNSCDITFLYSVFTHMRLNDVQLHLGEIHRTLAPSGKCLLTIYVEDWPRPEEENPTGYLSELGASVGALHRVVFDRKAFEGACSDASLSVERFLYRSEGVTKQSVYILSKSN